MSISTTILPESACIAVLFLLFVLLVIILVVVVVTTYIPFFYIALGDISQEGLMSKEEFGEIQKTWKGSSCLTALNHICAISFTKEPSVMTKMADILQKCGLSEKEEVILLKGRAIYSELPYSRQCTEYVYVVCCVGDQRLSTSYRLIYYTSRQL